tara:strand:- start:2337 stop:3218 length:882 start_codon:yes stop_codon:yes gene_type:complete
MRKPLLILCFGFPKTGTSKFYYELIDNKILHCGHDKESRYLQLIHEQGYPNPDVEQKFFKYCKKGNMKEAGDVAPFFDIEQEYFQKPFTYKKYRDYYLKLWKFIEPLGYRAVADFSTGNYALPDHIFTGLYHELKDYFHVKVLFSLRDPVNRAWSHSHMLAKNSIGMESKFPHDHYMDICNSKYFQKLYIRTLGRFINIFEVKNVHSINIEKFWSNELYRNQRISNIFTRHYFTNKYGELVGRVDRPKFKISLTRDSPFKGKKMKLRDKMREFGERQFKYDISFWKKAGRLKA